MQLVPKMGRLTILCFILFTNRWADGYAERAAFIKEPALWSLRCLYAGEDHCVSALSDYALPDASNITSPELEEMFSKMIPEVQTAFRERDLGRLTEQTVCHIPKPLLLIFPEKHLSSMRGEVLGQLLECNVNYTAIVSLISSSIETLQNPYSFFTSVQSKDLKEHVLAILADGIKSMSSINSGQWLVSEHNSVLEYLGLDMILNSDYNFLQWMRNIDVDNWNRRPQRVKRIWAFAVKEHILPQRFSDWEDSSLQSMGHFLLGSTVEELQGLDPKRIANKTKFFSSPFSIIQIRGLFDHFKRYHVLRSTDYDEFKGVVHQLLPKNLQQFYEGSLNLDELSLKDPISFATSRQIVEYIVRSNNFTTIQELVSSKTGLLSLNRVLYCLPLDVFRHLNYSLSFEDILPLQNHFLSLGQLYALTDGGKTYQLSLDGIDGAHDVLRGLPTVLLSGGVPNTVYSYLMSKLPFANIPRTAALLDNLIFKSSKERNYRSLFKNHDAEDFLGFLPSKYLERNFESLLPVLEHYVGFNPDFVIPEHVLSVLLSKATSRDFRWSSLSHHNISDLYPVLLGGLTCTDVKNMTPLDFIRVISRYNSFRTSHGWVFPKNLQLCSVNKFVEYLEMKTSFMTYYISNGLISLMTSSDVEAIGGFVLAGFPLKELRVAPVQEAMVKAIGRLSLPELLVACRMSKLMDLGELYFRPLIGKDLFNLGNLTAFLAAPNIDAVNPQDFKLMVESGLLDRRICVTDTQRDSWSYLIQQAFGPANKWTAQDLVTLGDLLLVIPHHDLIDVDPRVWAEAADVLKNTGYFEVLQVLDEPIVFYQLCENALTDSYEASTFRKELVEYVGWLITAVQHQLDSVVTASTMKTGVRMSPLTQPKMSDFASDLDNITCDAIRVVGKPVELYLTTTMVDEMSPGEIENCREEFAKMDLSKELASRIWDKLDVKTTPHLAGKLLSQASATDVIGWNLSFTEMWAHETIFYLANYNHNNDTLSALIDAINNQKLTLLSVEQVVALGRLTCQIVDARVTDNVFFKVSRHLGSVLPCDLQCLRYFEPSFQNVDAYGPISEWTPEDVESLGIFVAGLKLEDWEELVGSEKELLSRLRARALKCLPKEYLQVLTESAVEQLPTSTSTYLFNEFAFLLNSSVKIALENRLTSTSDFRSPPLMQFVYVWEDNRYVHHVMENSSGINQPFKSILFTLIVVYYYWFL